MKSKNLKITMDTLMGKFLFGDFGVLFWFLDKPVPTMWIWVWGLWLVGLGSIDLNLESIG
jgi:hypothetical protein